MNSTDRSDCQLGRGQILRPADYSLVVERNEKDRPPKAVHTGYWGVAPRWLVGRVWPGVLGFLVGVGVFFDGLAVEPLPVGVVPGVAVEGAYDTVLVEFLGGVCVGIQSAPPPGVEPS